jgi:hypothetical protein
LKNYVLHVKSLPTNKLKTLPLIMNKPFIEIDIGVQGILGLVEFYQLLNRHIDFSDFAKIKYKSNRNSHNGKTIDLNLDTR